ncbi:cell division protein FtsX [Proteiniborus ethanoligenes]|uniref:Cell division protein FtsX n=1 Tax=Proteiniborus ethanoligenes TaxID=415015 RepID=A0A1H3JSL8_9FIRM|nr:permease-like cell division protein FtsX [Proteiniborus ethanoligenes]SDY42916.1 cell division protein FtsX [Proteiniborus ethanoligenes]
MNNLGYFLKETRTIIKLNFFSNILSVFSMGFIFFILLMVISGGWLSSQMVTLIQEEAEISIYYDEDLEETKLNQLIEEIKAIGGINDVTMVSQEEAYNRMEKIMGKDASVLELFDKNPFNSFIEAGIDIDKVDSIVNKVELIDRVEYVRDNRNVLNRLKSISNIVNLLGSLVVAAVGVSTLVITSHIIRQGIYNNKEEINTLRLLGAPESFIVLPFIMVGLILTLGAGILATVMGTITLKYVYLQIAGPLPFIPLPALDSLYKAIPIFTIILCLVIGLFGSIFGIKSAKQK